VPGKNLCDLITEEPKPQYGILLGQWLATYHTAFQRGNDSDKVLLKGDARIRNFIYNGSALVGVDFEESVLGHYLQDLASACGSILDTDPLFTPEKFALCRTLLNKYRAVRKTSTLQRLLKEINPYIIRTLRMTAHRRGNPTALVNNISALETGALQF
jgi:aminoglycoside phosphotransferase (APT) family kinase protein